MNNRFILEFKHLLLRDIALEFKQRYALNSVLLYVISTVFVCYLSFKSLTDVPTWNALFWIILLFTSVNAAGKIFGTESRGRLLYYYSIASAHALIAAKLVYSTLLILLLSIIGALIYFTLIGNPVQDMGFFILALLLGSSGFSGILTLVSAIAAKTRQNTTLMAILSFPVLLPMLLVVIRFSKNAVDGLDHSVQYPYLFALLSMNVIVVALSWILFPFLWRD
ncbi:MAG: heme exporter protein CcmB [Bacteroidia bacterium]